MRRMTVGIEPIVWATVAILGIAAVAFVVQEFLPPFLLREPREAAAVDRSFVENGRVFCRVQDADIDVDACVGCAHLRVMDGRGMFIVCGGRAAAVTN